MSAVELVVDTNVVSYLFQNSALGQLYERLISDHRLGITGSTLAELRCGSVSANWSDRRWKAQLNFLQKFVHVPETPEMSELCGALRAERAGIGRPIDWPDAWAAACALWLDVPLVTHDRDLEGIPGLRVETLHQKWRVGEAAYGETVNGEAVSSGPVWVASEVGWPQARRSAQITTLL